MWDWLLQPIDPDRAHLVGFAVSWHGRMMTLAWGVLAPLTVLVARYFKIMPGQDWPRELDNPTWWRTHWIGQCVVLALTIGGVAMIFSSTRALGLHGAVGYSVLVLVIGQALLGYFRGTKGGPTEPGAGLHGDHYDMTAWRRGFEAAHKTIGYTLILLAIFAVILGLWEANAPRWMWLSLIAWWSCLAAAAVSLQRRGRAIDTYQAIWGPGLDHPGNRMAPQGWGMRRLSEEGKINVRRD